MRRETEKVGLRPHNQPTETGRKEEKGGRIPQEEQVAQERSGRNNTLLSFKQESELIQEVIDSGSFNQDIAEEVLRITNETLSLIPAIEQSGAEEDYLYLASLSCRLEEIAQSLTRGRKEERKLPEDFVLALLLRRLNGRMDALPKRTLKFSDPKQGIQALQEELEKQKQHPYTKLARGVAEPFSKKVESKVREWLDRVENRIPSKRLIQLIEKLRLDTVSAKLALGVTVFGLGFLALGGVKEAFGDVEVSQKQNGELEIKKDSGEQFTFVPLEGLDRYKDKEVKPNELFERLKNTEVNVPGVNYTLKDSVAFQETIFRDFNDMYEQLRKQNLVKSKQDFNCTPSEFIKTINAMVQEHLSYDDLATEKTPEGEAEDGKISEMPLDVMYNEYNKGVCRHYAALVEKIGEMLIRSVNFPYCNNLSIADLPSFDDKFLHSWNFYVLNALKGNQNRVVVTATDATWDDATGEWFDALGAKDSAHPTITTQLEQDPTFTHPDIKAVSEKLIEYKIGGREEAWAHSSLAGYYSKQISSNYKTIRQQDGRLSPEGFSLYTKLLNHAYLGASLSDYSWTLYYFHYDNLVDHYKREIEISKKSGINTDAYMQAEKLVQVAQALVENEYQKGNIANEYAQLNEVAGKVGSAEMVLQETLAATKGQREQHQIRKYLVNFYNRNGMFKKLESRFQLWTQEYEGLTKLPVLAEWAEFELRQGNVEKLLDLHQEAKALATEYKNLPQEEKSKLPLNQFIGGVVEHELTNLELLMLNNNLTPRDGTFFHTIQANK